MAAAATGLQGMVALVLGRPLRAAVQVAGAVQQVLPVVDQQVVALA